MGKGLAIFILLMIGCFVYYTYTEEINNEYYRLKEMYYRGNQQSQQNYASGNVETRYDYYSLSQDDFTLLGYTFENPDSHITICNTKRQRGYCLEREDSNCWDTVHVKFNIEVPREHLYGRCETILNAQTISPVSIQPSDFQEGYLDYILTDRLDITVDNNYSICCTLKGNTFEYNKACFSDEIEDQCYYD